MENVWSFRESDRGMIAYDRNDTGNLFHPGHLYMDSRILYTAMRPGTLNPTSLLVFLEGFRLFAECNILPELCPGFHGGCLPHM